MAGDDGAIPPSPLKLSGDRASTITVGACHQTLNHTVYALSKATGNERAILVAHQVVSFALWARKLRRKLLFPFAQRAWFTRHVENLLSFQTLQKPPSACPYATMIFC